MKAMMLAMALLVSGAAMADSPNDEPRRPGMPGWGGGVGRMVGVQCVATRRGEFRPSGFGRAFGRNFFEAKTRAEREALFQCERRGGGGWGGAAHFGRCFTSCRMVGGFGGGGWGR